MNRRPTAFFALLLISIALFLLACRTASLLSGEEASPTAPRATRAALRPTFTPIPTETETPPPTETPEPTQPPPPTDVPPTATRRPTARPQPTQRPATAVPTPKPATPVPSPTRLFDWVLNGGASCASGDSTKSVITGKITAHGKGAVGQRVQVSSGPGGEPASDPNLSNSNGVYTITLTCGTDSNGNTKACNGDFWIWIIDPNGTAISPFVKFGLNNNCRTGTQNFQYRIAP